MTLQPNKHAKFETRYPAETVAAIRILLRQYIDVDPQPSYRSIARQIESVYPVKISGTTVKRMMDKIKFFQDSKTYICTAPIAPAFSNPLTPNDTNANAVPKSGVAAGYAATDTKSCSTPLVDAVC